MKEYKICPNCTEEKPLLDFWRNRVQADGLQVWCKKCASGWKQKNPFTSEYFAERHREWYRLHKELQAQRQKEWRENNPDKNKIHNILANAGRMQRQKCSILDCNNIGERHHEQYTNPFEFVWLCHKHHIQHHKIQLKIGVTVVV